MITTEPLIHVGIFEQNAEVTGRFNGKFTLSSSQQADGRFIISAENGAVVFRDEKKTVLARGAEVLCSSADSVSTFTLSGVTIGISFHWERKEDQTFRGSLRLMIGDDGLLIAVNVISVEEYLKSVISSEMSAEAPVELLKAHAITSRSWLVAMLEREKSLMEKGRKSRRSMETTDEIIRWYDREDHRHYDVCADDHCQRYQGISKIISSAANEAVETTRGQFLISNDQICDARFYKACGGLTELFENAWENEPVPYLASVADSPALFSPVKNESDAEKWIHSSPDAYCNTADGSVLRQILPSFDQETTDFFRWKVEYSQEELSLLLKKKSGIDFGDVILIDPLERGPSGRIFKLRITGTKRTVTVGKELEIRKWFSRSHLYSSAFVVEMEKKVDGIPGKFILRGAGWGHGVGLCQIGAAVMAAKGFSAEAIVCHYFTGVGVKKIY